MHAFWKLEDPMERANQQVHLDGRRRARALRALFQQFGFDIGLTAGPTALFD